ncbi:helix-turn-helix domain-containing protein [Pseudonocardia sp. CA-107938]|uniref:helix-turn-helix domain-containing protein n=1 Tax=Pseudonocardia sp. CA-107938 TaxID=3240021 RepID=UPI003D92F9C1
MTASDTVQHELAAFLRSRRERLDPDRSALPRRRGWRRTPGLRREEVAELAGVSVDYVVRLEQGRAGTPSAAVLDALAEALQLTDDERAYVFDLADRRLPAPAGAPDAALDPALHRLISDLSPRPAMVIDHRYDIRAANPEMTRLMIDGVSLPNPRHNVLWLCILNPMPAEYAHIRETTVAEGVAGLRAAWAARPDDEGLSELVAELIERSPDFARRWAERDVRVNGRGIKAIHHSTVGPVVVEFEGLIPMQDPDLRVVVYRAADERSQRALDALREQAQPAEASA